MLNHKNRQNVHDVTAKIRQKIHEKNILMNNIDFLFRLEINDNWM